VIGYAQQYVDFAVSEVSAHSRYDMNSIISVKAWFSMEHGDFGRHFAMKIRSVDVFQSLPLRHSLHFIYR
jgi:hypothetical protein